MIIKTLTLGVFSCNNYLIMCEETNDAVLIDASGDYDVTMQVANSMNANLKYIFHTHGHLDHISGDIELKAKAGAKIFIHKGDQDLVKKFKDQLMMFGLPDMEIPVIDEYINDGQTLKVGKLEFKVIHTPGHTPGCVCFLVDDMLFSGDTLFRESVGRTDLHGGSYEQIGNSIKNKLFTLDDDIKVFPGHGPTSSIGYEKENNPFFGKNTTL